MSVFLLLTISGTKVTRSLEFPVENNASAVGCALYVFQLIAIATKNGTLSSNLIVLPFVYTWEYKLFIGLRKK